jgi:hypothetical protein
MARVYFLFAIRRCQNVVGRFCCTSEAEFSIDEKRLICQHQSLSFDDGLTFEMTGTVKLQVAGFEQPNATMRRPDLEVSNRAFWMSRQGRHRHSIEYQHAEGWRSILPGSNKQTDYQGAVCKLVNSAPQGKFSNAEPLSRTFTVAEANRAFSSQGVLVDINGLPLVQDCNMP